MNYYIYFQNFFKVKMSIFFEIKILSIIVESLYPIIKYDYNFFSLINPNLSILCANFKGNIFIQIR